MRDRFLACLRSIPLLFALFVLTPCFSEYPFANPAPREDFDELKDAEESTLSVDELTRLGWYHFVYENENGSAEDLFRKAIEKSPDEAWALYGMTVLSKVKADYNGQLEYVLRLCRTAPDHPLAVTSLNNLRHLVGSIDGVMEPGREVLTDLIYNDKIRDPFALNIAAAALAPIYSLQGDVKAYDMLRERRSYIRDWRLAGPFGRLARLAFFSELPPEKDTRLARRYDFADEEIVTMDYSSRSGRIDAWFMEDGVYFAETFLYTKAPRYVLLFISSGGPIVCSINGTRFYEKDPVREFVPSVEAVSVRLGKGWNRLRLKFFSDTGNSVSVQILNTDCTVPDIKTSSRPRMVRSVEGIVSRAVPSSGVKYFAERAEANPEDPLAPVLLAINQSLTGDLDGTKASLYRVLDIAPDWAYANYLLGQTLEKDLTQPRHVARGEAKKRFERAISAAGEYPSALSALAAFDADEGRDEEAIEKLEAIIEQAPGHFAWHRKLYDLYTAKGWEKERYGELLKVSELLHDSIIPLSMQQSYYLGKRRFDEYAETVMKLQKASIRGGSLAAYYRRTGDIDRAIAEYRKLRKHRPSDYEIHIILADLYERKGKIRSARKEMEKLLSLYPEDIAIMLRLAELYSVGGSRGRAREMYRRVLDVDRVNEQASKALEFDGEEDFFKKYEIDTAEYINDKSLREKYKSYSSVIVIDQTVERIFANGASRSLVHELILVNNKQGIEQWGEVSAPARAEVLELRTIKKDGTIIEPEMVRNKGTVSMTDTSEGDLIEIKYIDSNRPPFGDREAYLGRRFYFQTLRSPMVVSQYIVAAPKEIELDIEAMNMDDEPEIWEEEGLRFIKWERRDIKEITPEPFSVHQHEYMPSVRVGFNIDPELQSKSVVSTNIGATKAGREVHLKTAEITEGLETRDEKVRAIYDFVCTEIDGGAGSPVLSGVPGIVLANKQGDRLVLMKAMLDIAGVPSNVVMVKSRMVKESEVFPTFLSYPLLAIGAHSGDRITFLDLNRRYNSYEFIPPEYQGCEGRLLPDYPPGTEIRLEPDEWDSLSMPVTTPELPREANGYVVLADLEVSEDGSVSGTLKDYYSGKYGAALRNELQKIEEYAIRNNLERSISINYRGAVLTDYTLVGLKKINGPLEITYKFNAPGYATLSNGTLTFSQGFHTLNLGRKYVRLPKRETPMALYQGYQVEHRITLRLPEGSKVEEMPEGLSLDTEYGVYELTTKVDGNTFVLHRKLYLPIQKIYPAKYAGFIEFCRAIDKAEEKELKLTLPAEPEPRKEEEAIPDDAGPPDEGTGDDKPGPEPDDKQDDPPPEREKTRQETRKPA